MHSVDPWCLALSSICKLIMASYPSQEPAELSSSSLEEGKH